MLITFDVEIMYTNIDHTKGLMAVSEALGFRGPLYDGIMQLLELSLKIIILYLIMNGTSRPRAHQSVVNGHCIT